jgi:recombination protein RecT
MNAVINNAQQGSQIATLESIVGSVAKIFNEVSVDKSLDFQREYEFALQILYGNDYSCKLALANPQSVRNAITNVAAIGISLNPAKKQAYLVPRKGGICLDISYMGLVELAVASGSIRFAKAELVREQDTLVLRGVDKPPEHQFNPFSKDRGEIVGVYCVVKTIDGDFLTDTMSIDEVHAIRDRSEAWKAHVAKKLPCPWSTDPGEMIKKTLIKRASKLWPKTERLDQAVHYLNTDGGQGLDFGGQSGTGQATPLTNLDPRTEWIQKAERAQSVDEMVKVSKAGAKAFQATKDREGYSAFAKVVQTRGAQLRNPQSTTNQDVIDV